ncbi:hypothetical protein RRG08_046998 [Elysia crispata]|uniref:Uncharacterized protein n=1 Tax=Elysia crispata TaxID=231223 RepID=A0AAE1AA09_9GAST|nr:hypothetical protein RRG08_046998 [Elysia crispata]
MLGVHKVRRRVAQITSSLRSTRCSSSFPRPLVNFSRFVNRQCSESVAVQQSADNRGSFWARCARWLLLSATLVGLRHFYTRCVIVPPTTILASRESRVARPRDLPTRVDGRIIDLLDKGSQLRPPEI